MLLKTLSQFAAWSLNTNYSILLTETPLKLVCCTYDLMMQPMYEFVYVKFSRGTIPGPDVCMQFVFSKISSSVLFIMAAVLLRARARAHVPSYAAVAVYVYV